jgi:putative intracellular protease/amidase
MLFLTTYHLLTSKQLSRQKNVSLSIIAREIGLVSSRLPTTPESLFSPSVLATHDFKSAPPLDILLIPGGGGNRFLEKNNDTSIEKFVISRYLSLKYLLSTCTGSVTLANTGLLNGKRATSNKAAWQWVITHGKNVTWVPTARWVQDGNIWTSSGIAAGMLGAKIRIAVIR